VRKRILRVVLLVALGPWLLYLVLGNLLIATPLLQRLINRRPDKLLISYQHGYTLWPGHLRVSGFRLSFQSPRLAFELVVDDTSGQVALLDLFRKRFRTTHLNSSGVSYRMVDRPLASQPISPRLAAYPHLRGVIPLRGPTLPPMPSKEQIERMWTVQLEGVDSTVRELWVAEYRWRGKGHTTGAFGLKPLAWVWVGPCELALAPGELTVGEEVVSRRFGGHLGSTLDFVEVPTTDRKVMLKSLQGRAELAGDVAGLDFLRAYGLDVRGGEGEVRAVGELKDGVLGDDAELELQLENVRGIFEGAWRVHAAVEREHPVVRARLDGVVSVPLPGSTPVRVEVEQGQAKLEVTTNDFTEPWKPARFAVQLPRVQARDVRPVWGMRRAPFYAPLLFGDGPLTARGLLLQGTPKAIHVSVDEAHLGEARMHGEVEVRGEQLSGDLEGSLRELPIGVKFQPGETKVRVFGRRGGRW
jgi:hypothetical protein